MKTTKIDLIRTIGFKHPIYEDNFADDVLKGFIIWKKYGNASYDYNLHLCKMIDTYKKSNHDIINDICCVQGFGYIHRGLIFLFWI